MERLEVVKWCVILYILSGPVEIENYSIPGFHESLGDSVSRLQLQKI